LKVYHTVDEQIVELDHIDEKGSWLCLINPSEEEIKQVSDKTGITLDFLKHPLMMRKDPALKWSLDSFYLLSRCRWKEEVRDRLFMILFRWGLS